MMDFPVSILSCPIPQVALACTTKALRSFPGTVREHGMLANSISTAQKELRAQALSSTTKSSSLSPSAGGGLRVSGNSSANSMGENENKCGGNTDCGEGGLVKIVSPGPAKNQVLSSYGDAEFGYSGHRTIVPEEVQYASADRSSVVSAHVHCMYRCIAE